MTRALASKGHTIAMAALKIARVNHYLVGFDAETAKDLSWDDLHDARQTLVDMELTDTKNPHQYNRAFMALEHYARRVHGCDI